MKVNAPLPHPLPPFANSGGDAIDLILFEARVAAIVASHATRVQSLLTRISNSFTDRVCIFLQARLDSLTIGRMGRCEDHRESHPLEVQVTALLALGRWRALRVADLPGAFAAALLELLATSDEWVVWDGDLESEAEEEVRVADGPELAMVAAGAVHTVDARQPLSSRALVVSHVDAAARADPPHSPEGGAGWRPSAAETRSLERAIMRGTDVALARRGGELRAAAAAAGLSAASGALPQVQAAAHHAVQGAMPAVAAVAAQQADLTLRTAEPQMLAFFQAQLSPMLAEVGALRAAVASLSAAQAAAAAPTFATPARSHAGLPRSPLAAARAGEDDDDELDRLLRRRVPDARAADLSPDVFLQGARILHLLEEAGVGRNVGATAAARSLWETRVIAALPASHRTEAERAFLRAGALLRGGSAYDNAELARAINDDVSYWGVAAEYGTARAKDVQLFLAREGAAPEIRRALHATALAKGNAGERARAEAHGVAPSAADVEHAAVALAAGKRRRAPPKAAPKPASGNGRGREQRGEGH